MKNFITGKGALAVILALLMTASVSLCAFAEDLGNPEPTPTLSPAPTEPPAEPTPTLSPAPTEPPAEESSKPTLTPEKFTFMGASGDEPEIPEPAYTLNIPADQTVAYRAERHLLDCPTVTEASGFFTGKNIRLHISWTEFESENVPTSIPFSLLAVMADGVCHELSSGTVLYNGNESGTTEQYPVFSLNDMGEQLLIGLSLSFDAADWENAMPGEYKANISFSTEIVEQ